MNLIAGAEYVDYTEYLLRIADTLDFMVAVMGVLFALLLVLIFVESFRG